MLTTLSFNSGKLVHQEVRRGQGFERWNVTGAREHHFRIAAVIVTCPGPDAHSRGAVRRRDVDIQVLRRWMLAGHDHVDVVPAAQTMVRDGEQAVGIGRKVDADGRGFLVRDVIEETRILMTESRL